MAVRGRNANADRKEKDLNKSAESENSDTTLKPEPAKNLTVENCSDHATLSIVRFVRFICFNFCKHIWGESVSLMVV